MHGTPLCQAAVVPHIPLIPLSPDSVLSRSQNMIPPKPFILAAALADIKFPGQAD